MYNIYFFLFEFGAIIMLFFILWNERNNKLLLETLILVFIFGMVLESINAPLSKTYFYSQDFLFSIFSTPIAIGAGWLIVYYTTQKIAMNFFSLRWYQTPFLMALFAVMIDFILDPVAIRLGFWTWRIPLNQELFGVPYDNFVGWMAAIWTFAFFMNLSEQSFIKQKISKIIKYAAVIIAPILLPFQITIYLVLSALLSGKFSFQQIVGFYEKSNYDYAYQPEVQVWKMYLFVLLLLYLVIYFSKVILFRKRLVH